MKRRIKKKAVIHKPKTKFVVDKDLDKYEDFDPCPHKTAGAEELISRLQNFLPK